MHSAIPTHWLPFVLTARSQGWSLKKTMSVTLVASFAHALFTAALGLIVLTLGAELFERYESYFHYFSGAILILFGIYLIFQQRYGGGHSHFALHRHDHAACSVESGDSLVKTSVPHRGDRVAILALVGALFLSPCEVILPVYLSAVEFGWKGYFLLSGALISATTLGMLSLVGLTWFGYTKFKFQSLERLEISAVGALICLLGILVLFLGH